MRFSDRMVPEVFQTFWAAMQRGEFITDAAAEAGTYRKKGAWWLAAAGGVREKMTVSEWLRLYGSIKLVGWSTRRGRW